jgi:hypothetical protein
LLLGELIIAGKLKIKNAEEADINAMSICLGLNLTSVKYGYV